MLLMDITLCLALHPTNYWQLDTLHIILALYIPWIAFIVQ